MRNQWIAAFLLPMLIAACGSSGGSNKKKDGKSDETASETRKKLLQENKNEDEGTDSSGPGTSFQFSAVSQCLNSVTKTDESDDGAFIKVEYGFTCSRIFEGSDQTQAESLAHEWKDANCSPELLVDKEPGCRFSVAAGAATIVSTDKESLADTLKTEGACTPKKSTYYGKLKSGDGCYKTIANW